MAQDDIRIACEPLKAFTATVFERAGLPHGDAEIEADVLLWANLRGVDSHGVLRIPSYLDMVDRGYMNPKPDIRIEKETPAILFVEADRAFGPVVTTFTMVKAMQKAKNVGIGWGLIRNLTHQGAMGYYALMAAHEDMVGIAIVCSPPNMAPYGAKAAGLHNSPIAVGVPAKRHLPLNLDMATSVAAGGKLTLAQDKGVPLGEGWALDANGVPTTDAHLAQILLPAGGPKGSGLALIFQCLTSLMANNPLLTPVLNGKEKSHNQNSVVAAIDIGLFTDVETYKTQVDDLIDALKVLPKADGHDDILMPGEPENNVLADRSANGIPLPPGTVQKLRDVSKRLDIPLPEGL